MAKTNVCKNLKNIVLNPSEVTDYDSFEIEKVVKKEFSRTKDTLISLHETLKKEFQIPNGILTRLLIGYSGYSDEYWGIEKLNLRQYRDYNLEKRGVYPGDIIIIDQLKCDRYNSIWESALDRFSPTFPVRGRPRYI